MKKHGASKTERTRNSEQKKASSPDSQERASQARNSERTGWDYGPKEQNREPSSRRGQKSESR